MGWFDEQIRQRMESDQDILEDSLLRMASVVLDKWNATRLTDELLDTTEAVGEVLKCFHEKAPEVPAEITDPAEQLAFSLRPSGLMIREVDLEEGWQSDAYGPMLGYLRESGTAVALIPGALHGYHYTDPATGKTVRVTRRNAGNLKREAMCFYRPLPQKKLRIRDLLLYMKNSISTGDLVLIILAALAVTLVGKLEPLIYNYITGPVLVDRRMSMLIGLGSFLVASAFAAEMISMVRTLLLNRINIKTSMAVESSVMMRILSLPVSFFRGFSSGELANRAGAVGSLCTLIVNNVLSVGLSSLMSLLYITDIFNYAPGLVVPAVLIITATVVLSLTAALIQIDVTRRRMKLEAEESGMAYAMISGVQKIKLSGSEKRAFARWGRLYARSSRLEYNPPTFLKLNTVITTAISLAGTVLLYYLAVETHVSNNDYFAFSAAYGRVMGAFTSLAGIAISVAGAKPILEMAQPILEAEPEVTSEKASVGQLSGGIEMSHVTFRYDEASPYVLNDLSLKIKSGEYVAIVGRTGCGKSTLVRLLLGFEKPEKGTIFYDHYDLNSVNPRTVRRNIGVVIQNGDLFQGDIFTNITISAPSLTLDEAWAAAELAGIADDIRAMPMGMQTVISEGSGGVSGGQKQRLMIARAVAPKPKILIFDEATSALDNKTQKQVSDALDGLKCTRIVIAHRLSTIRNCDRILVMDKGAIIEEGTYRSLLAKNGAFAELVARQRLDNEDDNEEKEEPTQS